MQNLRQIRPHPCALSCSQKNSSYLHQRHLVAPSIILRGKRELCPKDKGQTKIGFAGGAIDRQKSYSRTTARTFHVQVENMPRLRGMPMLGNWLGRLDSNQDPQLQRLVCCPCTTPQ